MRKRSKLAIVVVLGPSALAVILFEVLLNATAMFNHSNIRIPVWLDRIIRRVIVTPDMHRVHHSVIRCEANSNFGFNLSWWDILLGTYRSDPADGHEQMTIGLSYMRDELQVNRLPGMLAIPFQSGIGEYSVTNATEPFADSIPPVNEPVFIADKKDEQR